MRDKTPEWKKKQRALAHRASIGFVVWNSLRQGTYNVGRNAAKRAARKARQAFKGAK